METNHDRRSARAVRLAFPPSRRTYRTGRGGGVTTRTRREDLGDKGRRDGGYEKRVRNITSIALLLFVTIPFPPSSLFPFSPSPPFPFSPSTSPAPFAQAAPSALPAWSRG